MTHLTLHGDALSWLDLMLEGVLPPAYPTPEEHSSVTGPVLVVSAHIADAADADGHLDLLDPEGVTLAQLTVQSSGEGSDGGRWLSGPVAARTGYHHVDHLDLRSTPAEVRASWSGDSVVAVWGDVPLTYQLRQSASDLARTRDGSVLEVVPVATGTETDSSSHVAPRLARRATTRHPGDRAVAIAAPSLTWSADDIVTRAAVAASYGATLLVVPADRLEELPVSTSVASATLGLGVELRGVAAAPAGLAAPHSVSEAVEAHVAIPDWLAEPAVAEELLRIHRPRSTAGFTVLLSGLSGSGKSTVARSLAVRLLEDELRSVSLLDGDVVRHHLTAGLGFSRADRDINVRRIGYVASEITKAGGIAVCCPIAPYDATRRDVRAMVAAHGNFLLVHVATPLEECERRDRKGLYAKARRGEIPEFTGISDPYEIPEDAEVVIDTTGRTVESCVDDVIDGLRNAGLIGG